MSALSWSCFATCASTMAAADSNTKADIVKLHVMYSCVTSKKLKCSGPFTYLLLHLYLNLRLHGTKDNSSKDSVYEILQAISFYFGKKNQTVLKGGISTPIIEKSLQGSK